MIIIRRAAQVAFFRRDALVSVSLDHRATADAALLVSGIAVVGFLLNALASGSFSVWILVATAINAVTVWIVMAGLTYLIGRLFTGIESRLPTVMRLQGFSYLPLLVAVLVPGSVLATACRVWFLALLVFVTTEALETTYLRAAVAVGGSLIGSFLIGRLFWGGGLF